MDLGDICRRVTGSAGHIIVDGKKLLAYLKGMTHELDAVGLLCPLPVLKTRKRLGALAPGDLIIVRTDDPAAVIDMPHYCNESGHILEDQAQDGDQMIWTIRKVG